MSKYTLQIGWVSQTKHTTDLYSIYSATCPDNFYAHGLLTTDKNETGILVYNPKTNIFNLLNAGILKSLDQKKCNEAFYEKFGSRIQDR